MRRRPDPVLLTAGLGLIGLGAVLLLESLQVFDLGFGLLAPAVLAVVGSVLLVSGLRA